MTVSLSFDAKRNALLATTGLVVAYVRTFLQYHRYSWDSMSEFLISWFIHYLAVGLVAAVSYAVIKKHEKRFLPNVEGSRGLGLDEAIVYVSLTLLVGAIAIFVLAHWPSAGLRTEQ